MPAQRFGLREEVRVFVTPLVAPVRRLDGWADSGDELAPEKLNGREVNPQPFRAAAHGEQGRAEDVFDVVERVVRHPRFHNHLNEPQSRTEQPSSRSSAGPTAT